MHVSNDGEELMDGEAIDKYNKGTGNKIWFAHWYPQLARDCEITSAVDQNLSDNCRISITRNIKGNKIVFRL